MPGRAAPGGRLPGARSPGDFVEALHAEADSFSLGFHAQDLDGDFLADVTTSLGFSTKSSLIALM
jgi:hypothetical protein